MKEAKKGNIVKYNKWGYIFLIPFVVVYLVFQVYPLVSTIFFSFFEYYEENLAVVGPTWNNFEHYIQIFSDGSIVKYAENTIIMWLMGFIPQILVSLLLGAWFSDTRLRLKAAGFFKAVIYLPNLIMASAFAMLFFTLFASSGPINSILVDLKILDQPFRFLENILATRTLVAFMNFIMWFGNTTILLMAGMMGIDPSLFEAAEVDGATSTQVFFRITLPLLRPILVYVAITSLVGGLQMFDVPEILTESTGDPNECAKTLIMYLNSQISVSKNYGLAGAISVVLFVLTGALSMLVFWVTNKKE